MLMATLMSCEQLGDGMLFPRKEKPLVISLSEGTEVKSILDDFDEFLVGQITSFGVYIYNDQGQLAAYTTSEGSSATVNLIVDGTYDVYVLANLPTLPEAPAEKEEFVSDIYDVSYSDFYNTGIPMCGHKSVTADDVASGKVTIRLTRLITRVGFTLDTSELETSNITVRSVKLCQTASAVSPFAGVFVADETTIEESGDYASDHDIQNVNSGQKITLYTLENFQGKLLPTNTDPWAKIPDLLKDKKELCTYLEVTADYSGLYEGVMVSSDKVVYRFYLGRDNITDFSLERNHGVDIKLTVSDLGVFTNEWKVDYGKTLPVVTYSLDITPAISTVYVHYSTDYKATYSKYVDGVFSTSSNVTSKATWSVDKTDIATCSGFKVTGSKKGTATVTASYKGESDTATINVQDLITYDYRFVIDGSSYVYVGYSSNPYTVYYYTDTYTNGTLTNKGTTKTKFTGSITWSVASGSSNISIKDGVVTGVANGKGTIKATVIQSSSTYTPTFEVKSIPLAGVNFNTGWMSGGSIDY